MIDASKIRVGDSLTINVKVVRRDDHGYFHVVAKRGFTGKVLEDEIATHTPAPRAFKQGDQVTWGGGSKVYQFREQQNGVAVIWRSECGYRLEPVSALRHADGLPDD